MNRMTFHIITQSKKFYLNIESNDELCLDSISEFLMIFSVSKENNFHFSTIQVVTEELKLKVKNYVSHYKDKFPHLNKFNKNISDLSNGEKFLIITALPTQTKDILDIELFLEAINNEDDEEKIKDFFQNKKSIIVDLFSEQIKNYNLFIPRNDLRAVIGNKDKKKRVCRFCDGTVEKGSKFQKVAHAIPEALGNKNIILADECDICNEFFGDNIEPHLIEYLNFHRVTVGIKGKEGYPKIKYKNGMAYHDGESVIVISNDIIDDSNGNLEITLMSNSKFIAVNFYKALCKIALSVIDENELKYLTKTLKWVKNKNEFSCKLPYIGMLVNNNGYSPVPEISILTKNDKSIQSPHVVGQFKLGSYLYVFILPFSDKDDLEFTDDKEMRVFFDMFPQYLPKHGWSYINFDSQEEIELKSRIKMENKPPHEDEKSAQ